MRTVRGATGMRREGGKEDEGGKQEGKGGGRQEEVGGRSDGDRQAGGRVEMHEAAKRWNTHFSARAKVIQAAVHHAAAGGSGNWLSEAEVVESFIFLER